MVDKLYEENYKHGFCFDHSSNNITWKFRKFGPERSSS